MKKSSLCSDVQRGMLVGSLGRRSCCTVFNKQASKAPEIAPTSKAKNESQVCLALNFYVNANGKAQQGILARRPRTGHNGAQPR